jgi:hypothetical protein
MSDVSLCFVCIDGVYRYRCWVMIRGCIVGVLGVGDREKDDIEKDSENI